MPISAPMPPRRNSAFLNPIAPGRNAVRHVCRSARTHPPVVGGTVRRWQVLAAAASPRLLWPGRGPGTLDRMPRHEKPPLGGRDESHLAVRARADLGDELARVRAAVLRTREETL